MSLDSTNPLHVAIIMDGNGRWAQSKGFSRDIGHKKGVEALQKILEYLPKTSVRYLTVYAFSSENWLRPEAEIQTLLNLLASYLKSHLEKLIKNHIRLHTIGRIHEFPKKIVNALENAKKMTAHCTDYHLTLALNYGSQNEIVDAITRYQAVNEQTTHLEPLSWPLIEKYLDTANLPALDLLIRTSGEYRLSNFLLMQSAYSELYFTPLYWPDFSPEIFEIALNDYRSRERRYGMISKKSI